MIPTILKNKKGFSYFELLAILVFIGIIATISFKGSGLIADIKKRDDIELSLLRKDNRNSLKFDVLKKIHTLLNNT